jgi:hypothetical protein
MSHGISGFTDLITDKLLKSERTKSSIEPVLCYGHTRVSSHK